MKNERIEGTYHQLKKVAISNSQTGCNEVDKKRLKEISRTYHYVFDNDCLSTDYKYTFEKSIDNHRY